MNTKELTQYRAILESQLDDNASTITVLRRKFQDHRRPDPGDEADYESEVSDFGLLQSLSRFEKVEHYEIELALRRIEDGLFGVCLSCQDEIPAARLEAKPYAVRCVKCQAVQDSADEHFQRQAQADGKIGYAV